jgi:hypothetical protein
MPAKQQTPDAFALKAGYLGALFGVCWAVTLLFGLWLGHENFDALAFAGAFGGAVAPWCVGTLVFFLSGRAGRPAGLITSVALIAALSLVQTFAS